MNVFMSKVKRTSEFVAMILFFVAAFFSLLYYIGNFDGAFMPVIGNLFAMVLQVGIWLVIPLCIVMKRRSYARWATLAVALYWLITTLFSMLDNTAMASGVFPPLAIAVGVFSFLTACTLIVMTAFALTAVTHKNGKIKMVAACIYVGALLFYLVLFALSVAFAAGGNAGWNVYFGLLCDDLLIPFAMFFIAVAFGFREEEFVFPCKKKAAPVEPTAVKSAVVEEKPAMEEPAEDKPAEETPSEDVPEAPADDAVPNAEGSVVEEENAPAESTEEQNIEEEKSEEEKPADEE